MDIALYPVSCVRQQAITIDSFTRASSGVCDARYASIQNSQCLWVAAGESIGLQWDINICASVNGHPAQITKLDGDQPNQCPETAITAGFTPACSALNACYTGRVRIDGEGAGIPPWGRQVSATIEKCTVPDGSNPLSECRALTLGCQPVPHQECVGAVEQPRNYPYCSAGCQQAADNDETLKLDSPAAGQAILLSPPTFYTVSETRQIGRSGRFDAKSSDPESGHLVWGYQVPETDGVLEENFSSNLFISRVRVFTSSNPGSFARQYISLLRLQANSFPSIDCSGAPADATAVTADSCPSLGIATPAYVRNAPTSTGQAVVWSVTALDAAHGGNAGLTPDSLVYIEFSLANATAGSGRPFISPQTYNFGPLPSGAQRTERGALKLDLGNSAQNWTIDSVSPPPELSLRVDGPNNLNAGAIRDVDVTFSPSSDGVKVGTGTITLHDPAGHQVSVSADLEGESGAQNIVLFPDAIRYHDEFDPQTHQPLPLPWRKRFLVENIQSTPMTRQSASISGTDAAAFNIYEGATGNSPVAPPMTIVSGNAELFSVDFCPTHPGAFSAQVTVTANEGTTANPIIGVRTVNLQGIAPDPPAALCP
ncbi:MAG: hypothetical protein JOZ55_02115 [Alphaproteobacteria bacterium]|nr:hypothetical protein [Alphaproteobacteria bacterium]